MPSQFKIFVFIKNGQGSKWPRSDKSALNIDVSVMLPIFFKRSQVPGPRLCYNITGLDQGQQYRVKVAAHIEGGNYGPFSQIGKSSFSDLKYF